MIDDLYNEMRRLAQAMMREQPAGHTLQATALVNEAFVRLADRVSQFTSVGHAKAVFAAAMRHELVDHARGRGRQKRGGSRMRIAFEDDRFLDKQSAPGLGVVDLHDALTQLARIDEEQAQVVEMRVFGGMTEPEIAKLLGLSERTVKRRWTMAISWLRRLLDARDGE